MTISEKVLEYRFPITGFAPYKHQAVVGKAFIESATKHLTEKPNTFKSYLFHLVTGAGKTKLAKMITDLMPEHRFLFLTPQIALTHQSKQDFVDSGIIQGSVRQDLFKRVVCGTIQTQQNLLKKNDPFLDGFDIIFIDEAHKEQPTINHIVDELVRLGKMVVFLTGTPFTGKLEPIPYLNQAEMYGKEFDYNYMVENGYLVPPIIKVLSTLNTAGISTNKNGEFNDKELMEEIDSSSVDVLSTIDELDTTYPTIVIAQNIKHANELTKGFELKGFRVGTVHSKAEYKGLKGQKATKAVLADLNSGALNIAVSVKMMTTGIDLPCIHNIILATMIGSVPEFLQTLGRGYRNYSNGEYVKSHVIVVDCFGTVSKHGHPFGDFTPEEIEKGTKKLSIKCQECSSLVPLVTVDLYTAGSTQFTLKRCTECQNETVEEKGLPSCTCDTCHRLFLVDILETYHSTVYARCSCGQFTKIQELTPVSLMISEDTREQTCLNIRSIASKRLNEEMLNSFLKGFTSYSKIAELSALSRILDFLTNTKAKYSDYTLTSMITVINKRNDEFVTKGHSPLFDMVGKDVSLFGIIKDSGYADNRAFVQILTSKLANKANRGSKRVIDVTERSLKTLITNTIKEI